MTRERLIQEIKASLGIAGDAELLNHLQDTGRVSDNCITLDDVATRDLLAIYAKP